MTTYATPARQSQPPKANANGKSNSSSARSYPNLTNEAIDYSLKYQKETLRRNQIIIDGHVYPKKDGSFVYHDNKNEITYTFDNAVIIKRVYNLRRGQRGNKISEGIFQQTTSGWKIISHEIAAIIARSVQLTKGRQDGIMQFVSIPGDVVKMLDNVKGRLLPYIKEMGMQHGYWGGFAAGLVNSLLELVFLATDIMARLGPYLVLNMLGPLGMVGAYYYGKYSGDWKKLVDIVSSIKKLFEPNGWKNVMEALKDAFKELIETAWGLNAQAGYVHGCIVFEIASLFFGAGEIKAALKAGKFAAETLRGINRLKATPKYLRLLQKEAKKIARIGKKVKTKPIRIKPQKKFYVYIRLRAKNEAKKILSYIGKATFGKRRYSADEKLASKLKAIFSGTVRERTALAIEGYIIKKLGRIKDHTGLLDNIARGMVNDKRALHLIEKYMEKNWSKFEREILEWEKSNLPK